MVLLATLAAVVGLKQPKPSRPLVVIPVLGFVASRLLSSMAAPDFPRSLQLLAPLLPALLLFFVLSEWVETQRQISVIFVSLTVVGFVLATTLLVVSWLSGTGDSDAWARAVPSPLLVVKNDITVVAVLAPLALAVVSLRPLRLVRLIVIGFFVSLVTATCVVQSRSALLTTVVAIGCFTALTRRTTAAYRAKVPLLLVGIVAVALVVDALVGFRFVHKALEDWQGNGRLPLWAAALAMFHDAPLLGQGPNSYVLHYRTYLAALHFPTWMEIDPRVTPWAHNLYVELLAEQGFVGLGAFLALGAVGLSMVKRINKCQRSDIHCLGAGAGAAFVAFLTAAFFELSFIRAWVTIILFTLLGLLTTIARSEHEVRA
jgi:O-antigen ligase